MPGSYLDSDLYRAIPALTRNLGFHGLSQGLPSLGDSNGQWVLRSQSGIPKGMFGKVGVLHCRKHNYKANTGEFDVCLGVNVINLGLFGKMPASVKTYYICICLDFDLFYPRRKMNLTEDSDLKKQLLLLSRSMLVSIQLTHVYGSNYNDLCIEHTLVICSFKVTPFPLARPLSQQRWH